MKIEVPVVVRGALRGEEDAAPKLAVSAIQALEDVKLKLAGGAKDQSAAALIRCGDADEADAAVYGLAGWGKDAARF